MIRITALLFSSALFFEGHLVEPITQPLSVKTTRISSDTETPYLREDFKYGNITTKSGRTLNNIKFRLNLVSNETECVFPNNLSTNLLKGAIKEINFKDTTSDGVFSYRLKTGYPPFNNQTRDHFYIILSEGRCGFLKSVEKKVKEKVNDMDRTIIREYETFDEYYLHSNGALKYWKKDKDFILAELIDKKEAVEKFVTENKTNFRSIEEVTRLINFYNGLN